MILIVNSACFSWVLRLRPVRPCTLDLDDPSSVKRAVPVTAPLPPMKPPRVLGDKVHQRLQDALAVLSNMMSGYTGPQQGFETRVTAAVTALQAALHNEALPLLELEEVFSVLAPRIPRSLFPQLSAAVASCRARVADRTFFNFAEISDLLTQPIASLAKSEAAVFTTTVAPLTALCERYKQGLEGYRQAVIGRLLEQFVEVERVFDQAATQQQRRDAVVETLRTQYADHVYDMLLSHQAVARKSKIVLAVLSLLNEDSSRTYATQLQALGDLRSAPYAEISVKTRHILMRHTFPSAHRRRASLEKSLRTALTEQDGQDRRMSLHGIADQDAPLLDVLVTLFAHPDATIRAAAPARYAPHLSHV